MFSNFYVGESGFTIDDTPYWCVEQFYQKSKAVFSGLGPRFRQLRRNWADVKCFSCGKTGNSANRCPKLDVTFRFYSTAMEV